MYFFKCTTLIILLSILYVAASNNDQRIDQLCGSTYAPTVCASCVKSKIGADVTDINIIASMLQCADDDANKLYNDTHKITDDILTDETVRHALLLCQGFFSNILTNGGRLRQLISESKIDEAKTSIDVLIFTQLQKCNQVTSRTQITIPPVVFGGMFTVEGDYKLSFQLMSSVHV